MNTLKNFRKGIFALLVGATTLVACSKDSDSREVPKGNYGVLIDGVELTYQNYQNISNVNFPAVKNGTVSYDPIKRVLTLDGVTIEVAKGEGLAAIGQPEGSSPFTIVLRNTNRLNIKWGSGGIITSGSLRITGDKGSLEINMEDNSDFKFRSIGGAENLTIEGGCSIVTNDEIAADTLTINKANVHVTANDMIPAFSANNKINLIGSKVVTPEGATVEGWQGGLFYTFVKDGKLCTEVKIEAK